MHLAEFVIGDLVGPNGKFLQPSRPERFGQRDVRRIATVGHQAPTDPGDVVAGIDPLTARVALAGFGPTWDITTDKPAYVRWKCPA
jgi:hypothetical protein